MEKKFRGSPKNIPIKFRFTKLTAPNRIIFVSPKTPHERAVLRSNRKNFRNFQHFQQILSDFRNFSPSFLTKVFCPKFFDQRFLTKVF